MDQVNIPSNMDLGKISSEMGGGAMIDETQMNDQVHQQIVGFLKTEKLKQFCGLATSEERIKFIYKNEAYWPLLQVIFIAYFLFYWESNLFPILAKSNR